MLHCIIDIDYKPVITLHHHCMNLLLQTHELVLICRDLSLGDVVFEAVLPMDAEVEHLQVKALVALFPVRLKVLDVAGSFASVYTFDPQSDEASSDAQNSSPQRSPGQAVQKFWLIYRPGHYEIVYPAEGFEDLDKL